MLIIVVYIVTLILSIHYILNLKGLSSKQQRMNILICVVFPIWGILLKISSGNPTKGSHHYPEHNYHVHEENDDSAMVASRETDKQVKPYADSNDNKFD